MPVRPALSVNIKILRVKNGPWAPERLSNMLSCPATGITRNWVMVGVDVVISLIFPRPALSAHPSKRLVKTLYLNKRHTGRLKSQLFRLDKLFLD